MELQGSGTEACQGEIGQIRTEIFNTQAQRLCSCVNMEADRVLPAHASGDGIRIEVCRATAEDLGDGERRPEHWAGSARCVTGDSSPGGRKGEWVQAASKGWQVTQLGKANIDH